MDYRRAHCGDPALLLPRICSMLARAVQNCKPLLSAGHRRPALHLRVVRPDPVPVAGPLVENAELPEVLLGAVAERQDQQAFLALFRHFAPRVKAYLRRQGADSAVAEELAHEVILKVWRRAAAFDAAKASAATWIYAIVRNTQIDALRRTRRPELDMDDAALIADSTPLPDEAVAHSERQDRVREALATLPVD